jgi:hypothetical protein
METIKNYANKVFTVVKEFVKDNPGTTTWLLLVLAALVVVGVF